MNIQHLLAPAASPNGSQSNPDAALSTPNRDIFEGPRIAKVHNSWAAFRAYLADYCSANDVQIGVEFTVSVKKRNEELTASKRAKSAELLPDDLESFRRTYVCRLGRKTRARDGNGSRTACPFRFTVTSVKRQGQWKVEITRGFFQHDHTERESSDTPRAGKRQKLRKSGCFDPVFTTGKSYSDNEVTATFATNQLSRMFKKMECDTSLSDAMDQLSASIAMSGLVTRESPPVWFIAESDVEFDDVDDFSSGSFRKSYCGLWKGSRVAVRNAKVENADDASAFLNEVDIWYNLHHPHVLQLFGACYIDQSFFVCEYVEYGSLDRYLCDHREKVWEKLHEIALGLQYLHDKGVVYGLLKCCTILVGKDGRAKLSDFRKSPLIRGTSWQTHVGSIGWMAPELLRGEKATVASDIYSFGMCILEAVSGKGPWLSGAGFDMPDAAIQFHVLRRKKLPVRPSSCPADVYELVQQMCRFNPSERVGMEQVIAVVKELVSNRTSPHTSCIFSAHEDELNIVSGGGLYYGSWHGSRVIVKVMEPESEGDRAPFS